MPTAPKATIAVIEGTGLGNSYFEKSSNPL
jgi:hypothetical protein